MFGVFAALALAALGPATVPDHELSDMRGGFRLPSGIEVALTVRSDTSVDGALLLRSVFSVAGDRCAAEELDAVMGATTDPERAFHLDRAAVFARLADESRRSSVAHEDG